MTMATPKPHNKIGNAPVSNSSIMSAKWLRHFVLSAGGILLAAALSRFLIAAGNAQVLSMPEPLLGIPLRYAVLFVGSLELSAALICLFGRQLGYQIMWLAWLSTNFIFLWIVLFYLHCPPQGTCIGSLTEPLFFGQRAWEYGFAFIPCCLALGSYAAAIWYFFKIGQSGKNSTAPDRGLLIGTVKMSCPACGVHIKFARQNIGQKISCPHCQVNISLRQSENLKISCFFCQGHIEFPSYAIGKKMPCPHCNMDITLKEPSTL